MNKISEKSASFLNPTEMHWDTMMNMLYEAHNSSFSYADHAAGISEKDQSWEAFSDTLKRHFETECLKHPSRNAWPQVGAVPESLQQAADEAQKKLQGVWGQPKKVSQTGSEGSAHTAQSAGPAATGPTPAQALEQTARDRNSSWTYHAPPPSTNAAYPPMVTPTGAKAKSLASNSVEAKQVAAAQAAKAKSPAVPVAKLGMAPGPGSSGNKDSTSIKSLFWNNASDPARWTPQGSPPAVEPPSHPPQGGHAPTGPYASAAASGGGPVGAQTIHAHAPPVAARPAGAVTGHSGTGENWVCSRCTYKNPSNVTQCQMCGFSRDQAKLMDEFPPLGGEAKGKKKSAVGKKK